VELTLTSGAPSSTTIAVAARAQDDPEQVRSVDRAMMILLALGAWPGEAGVTDLARSVGIHKSTTSRLLSTLMSRGLIEQNLETGKYKLGRALIRLGGQAEMALDFRSIALPELQRLARSVKETATLGVLRDDVVTTVAWCDESGMSRDRAGRRWPLHATAPGKVLLTNRPEREIIRLSRSGLTPYSPSTIVRVELLLEELARVRQRGFATAFGEHEPDVNAIAVPVFNHRAAVVAALEVRASGRRISPARVPILLAQIRAAAAIITESIGGVAVAN
jgi:DNA-binding IclR family transcriptional regulator